MPSTVSRIVLGCGNFGGVGSAPAFYGQGTPRDVAFALLDEAWALGITALDTADAYGGGRSEAWIGEWIASRAVLILARTAVGCGMRNAELERFVGVVCSPPNK